jgi:dipeptidyl aminopeptidase/acylaminoacyl peptidase
MALACASCAGAVARTSPRETYPVHAFMSAPDFGEVAISPDGREVAFTEDASGAIELYTLALDESSTATGAPTQRTRSREHVSGLVYAPDGSAIVFEMDRGGDERTDLWRIVRGGTAPETLSARPDTTERNARFSRDGRTLVFECDSPTAPFRFAVCTMDLASRSVQRRTDESVSVQSPRWSMDARHIVATRTGDDQHGRTMVIDVGTGAHGLVPQAAIGDAIFWPETCDARGRVLGLATGPSGRTQPARFELPDGAIELVGETHDVDTEIIRRGGETTFACHNVHGESELVAMRDGGTRVLSSVRIAHPRS